MSTSVQPDQATVEAEHLKQQGNDHFMAGDYIQAIELYTKSLDKKQTSAAFSNRACVFLKQNKYHEAYVDSCEAQELDQYNCKVRYRRAQALVGLERKVEAIRHLEICLKMSPGNMEAQQLLEDLKGRGSLESTTAFEELIAEDHKFALVTSDSVIIHMNTWAQVEKQLRNCHSPIGAVTFTRNLDEQAMSLFRAIDPVCFSTDVAFASIDFSKVPGSFKDLFDGIIKPTFLCLTDMKGVNGAVLSHALNSYSSMRNAKVIRLSDFWSYRVLKLKVDAVLQFLHCYDSLNIKCLCVQAGNISIGLEDFLSKLTQRFCEDSKMYSYLLTIECVQGTPKPIARYFTNPTTRECLTVSLLPPLACRVPLLIGDLNYLGGFRVQVLRSVKFEASHKGK